MANTDENIYGGVSLAGMLEALRPKSSAVKQEPAAASSLVSQIPTDTSPVPIPAAVPAVDPIDPSQLMKIEKGSYGSAITDEKQVPEKAKRQVSSGYTGNMPLRRDQEIMDKYSSGPIIATIDNNGQLSLSNTHEATLQKAAQVNSETLNLQSRMKEIDKETDLFVKGAMLDTFQADIGEQQTKELNKFRAIAESQLGIPTLRQQLAASERLDKQSPNYGMFLSDSPGTARIRQALAVMEGRASQLTLDIATRDPMFIRRGLEVKGFLERQNRFISNRMQQEVQIADRKSMKAEDQAFAIEKITGALTPQGKEVLTSVFPTVTSDQELARRAYPLLTGPSKHEWDAVLDPAQTPKGLLKMSVLGSTIPDAFVIKKQSESTGESPATIQEDLRKMRGIAAGTGKELNDLVQKFGTTQEKETFKALHGAQVSGLMKGKEKEVEWRDLKASWTIDMMARAKSNAFFGNVNLWGSDLKTLPGAAPILDSKPAISFEDFAKAYITNSPKEERMAKMQAVTSLAAKAADRMNSGIYGQVVDKSTLKAKLDAALLVANIGENPGIPMSMITF